MLHGICVHITHRRRSFYSCVYIYGIASINETCVTGVMVTVAISRRLESRTMLRTTSAESNWKNATCHEATAYRNWLLASAILGITLSLTASNFRADAPAASIHAARAVAAKPRVTASLPPHLGVASGYPRHRYIVQADSAAAARDAVLRAGGVVSGDLSVIRAVAAALDEREIGALRSEQLPQLHIYNDSAVVASSLGTLPETYYPSEVDAANLHVGGMTGRGVTVAVIDSGLWNQQGPLQSAPGTEPQPRTGAIRRHPGAAESSLLPAAAARVVQPQHQRSLWSRHSRDIGHCEQRCCKHRQSIKASRRASIWSRCAHWTATVRVSIRT